jgi:hypothetical protein
VLHRRQPTTQAAHGARIARATIARGVSLPLPNNVFSTSMIGRVMSRQPLKRSWGGERKKRPRRSRASADGSLPAANIDRFRENPMPTSAGDILSVGQPGRGSIQIAKEAGLRRPQYICRTRYIARLCEFRTGLAASRGRNSRYLGWAVQPVGRFLGRWPMHCCTNSV